MRARMLASAVAVLVVLVGGCTADQEPVGPAGSDQLGAPQPAGASELTAPPSAAAANQSCGDPQASLRPAGALPSPGQMPAGSTMARIVGRGSLIAGVDQNTFKFGFRNPFNGNIEGFDVAMARHIAAAIFGDESKIQFKILTSAQREAALENNEVDIVVRTYTVNCARREKINFSSVYYESRQRVLVKKGTNITGLDALGGKKVCAAAESTSLRNIANAASKPVPVSVPNWTDCLVMLQQNQVEAISTDDTILAGMVAQDPFTELVGETISAEPYGMGIPKANEDFVRFVNGVLEQLRANGTWTATYNAWLAGLLGAAPLPPVARYSD
jgi:polar amino acid transport system substrate-binding protein